MPIFVEKDVIMIKSFVKNDIYLALYLGKMMIDKRSIKCYNIYNKFGRRVFHFRN